MLTLNIPSQNVMVSGFRFAYIRGRREAIHVHTRSDELRGQCFDPAEGMRTLKVEAKVMSNNTPQYASQHLCSCALFEPVGVYCQRLNNGEDSLSKSMLESLGCSSINKCLSAREPGDVPSDFMNTILSARNSGVELFLVDS